MERADPATIEREAAKRVKGRRVAASGATPWGKEDIKNDEFLFQHKDARYQKSHSIQFSVLDELRKNAVDENRSPAYWIETRDRSWFIIPEEVFREL